MLEDLAPGVQSRRMSWEEAAKEISAVGPERTSHGCRNRWKRDRQEQKQPKTPEAVPYELMDPSADWDEWIDHLIERQALVEEADPIFDVGRTRIDTDKPIIFQAVGDIHMGSRFVCYPEFREVVKRMLSTPRVYWGMHAEDIEGFNTSFRDARAVLNQLVQPKIQRILDRRLLEMLHEDGRLLYGVAGTPSHGVVRAIGQDLIQDEYQRLHVWYFVGKAIWILELGDQEYVFMVGHRLPGTSIYNPNHAQIRALLYDCPVADFIISGHTHAYGYQEIMHHELAFRAGVMPINRTHLVNVGTAKTGPDPYAMSNWRQGVLEWPCFALYPDRHEIKRVSGWEDVNHYLELES
jgi:hypothetical protein